MVIELCVVQFWSKIILVISNQTRAARSFDFEIRRTISDQIALHSVQLPSLTGYPGGGGGGYQLLRDSFLYGLLVPGIICFVTNLPVKSNL